jgi:hypothetical protein
MWLCFGQKIGQYGRTICDQGHIAPVDHIAVSEAHLAHTMQALAFRMQAKQRYADAEQELTADISILSTDD